MTADKTAIRRQMRERAEAFLRSGAADAESVRILASVEALPAFEAADCVLIYMALPDEVQTAPLLEGWAGRKRFVIPRVRGQELDLREYAPDRLQPGYKGILEPTADATPVSPAEVDLALIPGVAFAGERGAFSRLGRGKGFYDRLLPSLRCPKVGICYPFRLVDSLPTDPWDIPLDGLIF
ncbi:MAG: 5-formyltetrahydrofolate cyclo-ligase [Bacteroidales bacterium]|nr:5-formyltetrahydrofolate cyclo-ligase [Bacteroidales bacterium]